MQSPTVTVRPAVQGSKELGVFEREGVQTLVITVHCPLDHRVGKTVPPSVPSGLGWASLSGHPAVRDPWLQLCL